MTCNNPVAGMDFSSLAGNFNKVGALLRRLRLLLGKFSL
jgi:hypothetical protein